MDSRREERHPYQKTHSIEYRKAESENVRNRFPDRVPVICERAEGSKIPDVEKPKFLAPGDITLGQFILTIRKRVYVPPEQAIFLFIGNIVPSNGAHMSDLYAKHKDKDGFLYVKYSGENTFGATA
jgi:GABA(A) receptor-associated protein